MLIRHRLLFVVFLSLGFATSFAQAQAYRMCRISEPAGTWDTVPGYADSVAFTSNPTSWRYGRWGGSGWTNGAVQTSASWNGVATATPVDAMDALFRTHDIAYRVAGNSLLSQGAADAQLACGLANLPKTYVSGWGFIYKTSPTGAPSVVRVPVFTFAGTQWRDMPYSEYARQQAVKAMTGQASWKIIIALRFA